MTMAMDEATRKRHLKAAEAALSAYLDHTGARRDDPESAVGDLMADLGHLARELGCDAEVSFRCGIRDYVAECGEAIAPGLDAEDLAAALEEYAADRAAADRPVG